MMCELEKCKASKWENLPNCLCPVISDLRAASGLTMLSGTGLRKAKLIQIFSD